MTIPHGLEGFAAEAKYWLEFADKQIRRFVILIAVWFGLLALSLAWNLKGLPGHSLAPFLAFVPSVALTFAAIYVCVRLANLLTACLLLIPWVRRKAEKLVALFACIYIATFLIGLLIAIHFWDIPSPGRFALIMLVLPIAILFVLARAVRSTRVTAAVLTAGLAILSLLTFGNVKFDWYDGWKKFRNQPSQATTIQSPTPETRTQTHREQGRTPALAPSVQPPQSEIVKTEEVYNPDNYLFAADRRVFEFDRSAYPYRKFSLTFPVGQWVAVKTPTTQWDALPTSGKPCTRAYFMAVHNHVPDGNPRERNWCDQSPRSDLGLPTTFLVQAVQADNADRSDVTIEFTNKQINIPDEPTRFVSIANRTTPAISADITPPTLHGTPEVPCTDEIRHMNFSGSATVTFSVTFRGDTENVQLVQSTGIPQLDQKVIETVKNYKFDPATHDDLPVPFPMVTADVKVEPNCHE